MDGAHCACARFRRVERLRPFDVVHAERQEVIAKDDVETEDVHQQQPRSTRLVLNVIAFRLKQTRNVCDMTVETIGCSDSTFLISFFFVILHTLIVLKDFRNLLVVMFPACDVIRLFRYV